MTINVGHIARAVRERSLLPSIDQKWHSIIGINPATQAAVYMEADRQFTADVRLWSWVMAICLIGGVSTSGGSLGILRLSGKLTSEAALYPIIPGLIWIAFGIFALLRLSIISNRSLSLPPDDQAEALCHCLNNFVSWTGNSKVVDWSKMPDANMVRAVCEVFRRSPDVAVEGALMPLAREIGQLRFQEERRAKKEDPLEEIRLQLASKEKEDALVRELSSRYDDLRFMGFVPDGGFGKYLVEAKNRGGFRTT